MKSLSFETTTYENYVKFYDFVWKKNQATDHVDIFSEFPIRY